MKTYTFKTFKGKNKEHYFHLKASNGKIILQSEGYKSNATMLRVITSLINHIPLAKIL